METLFQKMKLTITVRNCGDSFYFKQQFNAQKDNGGLWFLPLKSI